MVRKGRHHAVQVERAIKTSRIVYLCISAVYLLTVCGATIYSLTAYRDQLRQKINTTFIYVTHDQTEAMTLGDRIVIMKDGFIQQIGTPQEVFDHPANLFVAGFIGVWPGYLMLAREGQGLAARVEVTEMMGSEAYVHCSVNGKDAVLIVPTVEKDGQHFQPPEVGEEIRLGFSTELCHLFGEHGENLEL